MAEAEVDGRLSLALSTKGKHKALYKGFCYWKTTSAKDKTYWRCEKTPTCKASLVTLALTADGTVTREPSAHNHHADPTRKHAVWAKGRAKEMALAEPGSDPAVLHGRLLGEAAAAGGGEAVARTMSAGDCKRSIRRARAAADKAPRLPEDLDDLEIPQRYRDYLNLAGATEDSLLYYGPGAGDGGKFLIFGTQRSLALLNDDCAVAADGTWSVAPAGFMQVYTLHVVKEYADADGERREQTLPSLYVLLQNKDQDTYSRLIQQICVLVQQQICVHQRNRAVEGLAATNNAVEASHRRLQTHLRVRHPTLWLFMEELKKLLRADEARLVHLAGGGAPEKMAPKYRTRATRLAALCARPFPPDDPGRLDFLKAVSHLHKH